ncbi:MAG: hypothetical protein RI932_1886 [Pseudomonadota bacterium]
MVAPQNHSERIFKLRVWEDASLKSAKSRSNSVAVGELWHGKGRVPISGMMSYRGRIDAVITFFVDQFMSDSIFQPGDTLLLAGQDEAAATIFLARRPGSA